MTKGEQAVKDAGAVELNGRSLREIALRKRGEGTQPFLALPMTYLSIESARLRLHDVGTFCV